MPFPISLYSTNWKINFCWKHKFWKFFRMLENAEIKKSASIKTVIHTFDTDIFGQHDPGKTPYNSWGKPIWELLISEKCFLQWEKYSEISTSKLLQLISFSVLNHRLGKCADSKTEPAINDVRISLKNVPRNYSINFCCMASSFCVQNSNKCWCTASLECVQLY